MSQREIAIAHFKAGCNCAQAVLLAFHEEVALDETTALRLAAPFGGGFGRQREVCGAVSGGLMGLGQKYGDENNRKCGKSQEFLRAFKAEFGCLLCREILEKHQKKLCPALINFAANYLEDELK